MTLRLSRDDVRGLVASGRIAPADLSPDVRAQDVPGRTQRMKRAGFSFATRSRWESNYACWLRALGPLGMIAWRYEPQVFRFVGITRGCREYRPDFEVIFADRPHEWHEVKGWHDPKSKTRLKRMTKYYPKEVVVVIARNWFVEMERTGLSAACPGWERL